MHSPFFIAFEGPIAAGKTTLAGFLAQHVGGQLLLEEFEQNEFISSFYEDPVRWALPMQLWFLARRRQQALTQVVLPNILLIADYSYRKDAIFADMLLAGRELNLFQSIDALLHTKLMRPNRIIYLDANNNVLLDRIRKRGRPYEQNVTANYINSLRYAYETNLLSKGAEEVVCFDTSSLNLEDADQMDHFYATVLKSAG